MDALQSMGLVQTYFTHPDYLVVQCWLYTTYLSPDTIKQMGSQTYRYGKFFDQQVGYIPLGDQCSHIVVIIYQTNAAMPFVVTAYPAASANHMLLCCKMSGFNTASMNLVHVCYVSSFESAMSMNFSVYACAICSFYLIIKRLEYN